MSEKIFIPEANRQNISIFSDYPSDELVEEIIEHVRKTSSPHTWRGHSHTRPEKGVVVKYVGQFDVPAPDHVERIAPCPCCSPEHAKYKNKGKIAWFPEECVIRLIGPECYKSIDAAAHKEAVVELNRQVKRRNELSTLRLHAHSLEGLIKAIDEAMPIAEDLDQFMRQMKRVLFDKLGLYREIRGGDLHITQTVRVPKRRSDGTIFQKNEDRRVPFRRVMGHSMIDGANPIASALKITKVPLEKSVELLKSAGRLNALDDKDRERLADQLPRARAKAEEIFHEMRERQLFLTSDAMDVLALWGRHPQAPLRFDLERRNSEVLLSASSRLRVGPDIHIVNIGKHATRPIPKVPPLSEP